MRVAMWSRGDAARAIDTLQAVVRERPDLTVAYDRLAFMLRATGRVRRRDRGARRSGARRPRRPAAPALARLDAARRRRSPAIGGGARAAGARRRSGSAGRRRARSDLRADGARRRTPKRCSNACCVASPNSADDVEQSRLAVSVREPCGAMRSTALIARDRDRSRARHRPQRPRRRVRAAGADGSRDRRMAEGARAAPGSDRRAGQPRTVKRVKITKGLGPKHEAHGSPRLQISDLDRSESDSELEPEPHLEHARVEHGDDALVVGRRTG